MVASHGSRHCGNDLTSSARSKNIALDEDEALLLSLAITADTAALTAASRVKPLDVESAKALEAVHGQSLQTLMAEINRCMCFSMGSSAQCMFMLRAQ
jgi:hypothetical protein